MYTVKANIPIKQYFYIIFYFGLQCPWAMFDLTEMLYSLL